MNTRNIIAKPSPSSGKKALAKKEKPAHNYDIRPEQSTELLKALHILTVDGKLNQDSRRKLKQVYHLVQFIEPLLTEVVQRQNHLTLVDHGAGKSYLGFILYDLFFRPKQLDPSLSQIYGIETRDELVKNATILAQRSGFKGMKFLNLSVAQSIESPSLPKKIDVVTALHACDTATDDAISFALKKQARHIVLVPCCQAEVAATLKRQKNHQLSNPLSEIWRHPTHTREFGSHLTNVLRCLQLQAHGYDVTVTELVGWEHSMKNELILASRQMQANGEARYNLQAEKRLNTLLEQLGLASLSSRFFII